MVKAHSFHIPVMGIGFTIDTPLKVSQYGIDSVISLGDDILLEKLRKMYCEKYEIQYKEISEKVEDFRAKRITSYLNLINGLAEKKFEAFKDTTIQKGNEIKEYFNLLPDSSEIKKEFTQLISKHFNISEIGDKIKNSLTMGSFDVNIMTKLDKENYFNGEKLPTEYNDAHAALRGYANSDLSSSVVFSAGMNPRLYSYLEQFEDFYPNEKGEIKKKIILKVSDYRSALIQGKFLAKKGLWVSEYRIESGLNCGGHAFATDGFLIGPILADFRDKREELIQSTYEIFHKALATKEKFVPSEIPVVKVTAQGGVGTAEEHKFLLEHYQLDSVGWGTPFLLVPEATTVDDFTLSQLLESKEKDLYLSNISPLGVPFNNLRGNMKDFEKEKLIEKGKPGSNCPKKFLSLNKEFTDKSICTASRQYQHLKLKELKDAGLTDEEYQKEHDKVVDKSCICVGLGTSALLVNNIGTKAEGEGVSVCPGPNMAYFSRIMSLSEITGHIYGRENMITRIDRPNMFLKELSIYVDYLKNKWEEVKVPTPKDEKYFKAFSTNLKHGIDYYSGVFNESKKFFREAKNEVLNELNQTKEALLKLDAEIKENVK